MVSPTALLACRRPGAVAVAVVMSLTAAVGCTADRKVAAPTTNQVTTSSTPAPAFVERTCPMKVPARARITCGTVTVAEDHQQPGLRSVILSVARIHSTAATPLADPVVYLHGGPGAAVLDQPIDWLTNSPVLANRDIITFDQRGAGTSTPDLECPEREQAFIDLLANVRPYEEEVAAFDVALRACHDRLTRTGVDLDQYNTAAAATDLDLIRRALGIRQWNLWGASYGTRLALEEMRTYPDGIRSVVLDSVYPPTAGLVDDVVRSGTRAFQALADGCAADSACHRAIPDLMKTLRTLVQRLDDDPEKVTYRPPDGKPVALQITGQDALGGLFTAMYDTSLIPLIPKLMNDVAHGDYTVVPEIADTGIPKINDIAEGATMSYECADNATKIDLAKVADLRRDPHDAALGLLTGWSIFCADWPVTAAPLSFSKPVRSDIPTLVFAGEYDPITPPTTSRDVANDLGNAVLVEVPRGGHGVATVNECAAEVFSQFWDDLTDVDRGCTATFVPPRFVL